MNTYKAFEEFKSIIKSKPEKYYRDYFKIKEKVANSSAIYNGKPIEFLYQPMLFTQKDINKFKNVCNTLTNILKKVIYRYIQKPEFREHFGFPQLMEELILQNPGYEIEFPMARFDIFYSFADQNIKLCELNADGSTGMNENRVLQKLFFRSKAMQKIKADYQITSYEYFNSWLNVLLKNYNQFNPEDNKPNIAIVDFTGEGVESEFEEFKKCFMEHGYRTVICDPRNLNYNQEQLYFEDFPVDLIYRRMTTARLIQEADDVKDFIKAYKDDNVCVVGGIVSQLIHNKVLFAILNDKEKVNFLNEDELRFINEHIPYTRIFDYKNDKLLAEARENKDKYIVKPFDSFACQGVYVGKNYTQKGWNAILKKIRNTNYLLQEFYQVPKMEMLTIEEKIKDKDKNIYFEDYNYMIGLYMYNQKFKGIYTRVGRENIIGSRVECFTIPTYVIE